MVAAKALHCATKRYIRIIRLRIDLSRQGGAGGFAEAFAEGEEGLLAGQQGVDDLRGEVGAGFLADHWPRDVVAERVLGHALAGEGVVDVRQPDNAAEQGDWG